MLSTTTCCVNIRQPLLKLTEPAKKFYCIRRVIVDKTLNYSIKMVVNAADIARSFSAFMKPKDVDVYGNVFKLHTKFTVMILLIFSTLGMYFSNQLYNKKNDFGPICV